jgi:hypothetical protein
MNVNYLKPQRHDKAMRMWRGTGILMGNLVVIICSCIYGFFYLIIYLFFIITLTHSTNEDLLNIKRKGDPEVSYPLSYVRYH